MKKFIFILLPFLILGCSNTFEDYPYDNYYKSNCTYCSEVYTRLDNSTGLSGKWGHIEESWNDVTKYTPELKKDKTFIFTEENDYKYYDLSRADSVLITKGKYSVYQDSRCYLIDFEFTDNKGYKYYHKATAFSVSEDTLQTWSYLSEIF